MTPQIMLATKILDIILLGATLLPEARAAGEALAVKLKGFGDRDPTTAEWAELDAEFDRLMAGLHARADEAREELARRAGEPT